jgi:predicted transposase YdaD
MKKGEEIGLKKGEEKGMKLGEEKSLKFVAERMLIEGSTISQIAKITGLSFEFVESLISLKSQGNAD